MLEYSKAVKLLEYHLEFLSFKGVCTGLSESTLVKMSHCLISHIVFLCPKLITYLFLSFQIAEQAVIIQVSTAFVFFYGIYFRLAVGSFA